MAKTLEEVLAKEAIRDLVLNYSRAIDRKDFALLSTLYHDDSVDEHGGLFHGSGPDYVEWIKETTPIMPVLSHQVMNHYIVIGPTGDYAEGEVYIQGYHLMPEGVYPQEFIIGGRYLDQYTKRDGEWRFSRRRIVQDWHQMQDANRDPDSAMLENTPQGSEIETDPSNGYFTLIKPGQRS